MNRVGGKQRLLFLNPVLLNPWRSVMPLGYSQSFNQSFLNFSKQETGRKVRQKNI